MNRICPNHEIARLRPAFWLAALVFLLLLGGKNAGAQTPASPQAPPHWQAGVRPPTAPRPPASTEVETPKTNAQGEQFLIVASIDQAKSEILLKRPDEVTSLLNTAPTTKYLDENGEPLRLSDLRAGDTVWVAASRGTRPTAISIRKGQMTVADLHRYYLDYPEIK